MADSERIFAASVFFWEAMDRWDQTVSLEVAHRQIHKLAEGLPPFTPIKDPAHDR